MSKLTKIHEKILNRFNAYLVDTTKTKLLAENIRLFEEIPEVEVKSILKKASAFNLIENNNALLVIAESYLNYALEKKDCMELDNLLNLLKKAIHCYQMVIDSSGNLPPHSITKAHSDHILIANFYVHKVKFHKAEIQLFFIDKEMANDIQDVASTRKTLQNIINECQIFHKKLMGQYKDTVIRDELTIDEFLLHSIQEGQTRAEKLLSELPQHTPKRRFNAIDSVVISTTLENQSTPSKRKKTKQKSTSKKKDNVQHHTSSTEQTIVQTLPNNQETDNQLTGLDYLSIIASSCESIDLSSNKEKTQLYSSIQQTQFTSLTFWSQTPVAQYIEDSKNCLSLFKKWSDVYFNIKKNYSGNEKTSKSLEKMAHSLLLAATALKKESPTFQNQLFNPVIQVALQLFSLASEKGANSANEALEKIKFLSKNYALLLKPFVRSSLAPIHPENFISCIKRQFLHENEARVSFHGLTLEETFEQLFKHLESVLTADDYDKTKKCCFECFTRAHDSLVENRSNTTTNVSIHQNS